MSLLKQSVLGCRLFHFITLNISCHSLLTCRVSVEKSADNLIGVPMYVICHFSLVAFNILSLSLIFVSLINMCLGVLPFEFYSAWDSLCFLGLVDYLHFHVRKVFSYYLLKYFLRSCLFSFWDPYNANVVAFNVAQGVS